MKEKMKSEIESITINAATFSNVQIFPTYINFFYGRNGVGKTTIADAIRNGSTLQWSETAKPDDIEILVYDAEYISRNFHSFDNLQGVFMVFEENIEIQTQIEGMEKELLEKREAYKQCETEIQKKKAEKIKTSRFCAGFVLGCCFEYKKAVCISSYFDKEKVFVGNHYTD